MIFYRKPNGDQSPPLRVKRVRGLSTVAIAAYVFGCLLMLLSSQDGDPLDWAALSMMALSVLALAGIVSAGVSRITGDDASQLDEMEIALRNRAYALAYHGLGGVALLGILYMNIATSTAESLGLWAPTTADHWSAIMWGAILLALILPTAVLPWSLPAAEIDGETM